LKKTSQNSNNKEHRLYLVF